MASEISSQLGMQSASAWGYFLNQLLLDFLISDLQYMPLKCVLTFFQISDLLLPQSLHSVVR